MKQVAMEEEALHKRLVRVYEEMKKSGRFELSRDLDFRIKKVVDGRKGRVAKLKGNRIIVSAEATSLPKSALKYVIAHEVAHKFRRRHSERFWQVVENIYPNYEHGRNLLEERFIPSVS